MSKPVLCIVVVCIALIAWAFRWQTVAGDRPVSDGTYLINRWTGEVHFISVNERVLVKPVDAAP